MFGSMTEGSIPGSMPGSIPGSMSADIAAPSTTMPVQPTSKGEPWRGGEGRGGEGGGQGQYLCSN